MPTPELKSGYYSYSCEVEDHQIFNTPILPIRCKGCGRQMCNDHRIKWGPYCAAYWTTVPLETQQSLIAEFKAIRKSRRIQFLKDLGKTVVLAPFWFVAYLWQKIKKQRGEGRDAPKPAQHLRPEYPNSDHPAT